MHINRGCPQIVKQTECWFSECLNCILKGNCCHSHEKWQNFIDWWSMVENEWKWDVLCWIEAFNQQRFWAWHFLLKPTVKKGLHKSQTSTKTQSLRLQTRCCSSPHNDIYIVYLSLLSLAHTHTHTLIQIKLGIRRHYLNHFLLALIVGLSFSQHALNRWCMVQTGTT